jgi:neutral ceramidase
MQEVSIYPRQLLVALILAATGLPAGAVEKPVLRAGAVAVDITPTVLPSPLGNGWKKQLVGRVHDPLWARALVLDDGVTKLAMVVVDSTAITREICDDAKRAAQAATGIPMSNMLMSATHNHSAPAAMELALNQPDEHYPKLLRAKLAEAVIEAHRRLEPAKVGVAAIDEPDEVFCRRWKVRAGKVPPDPFGRTTDRVKMNPGALGADLLEPAGPVDPQLSIVAAQTLDGRPIALFATYSLHYVGGVPAGTFSADYFAEFAHQVKQRLKGDDRFTAAMANGTSGDINNHDYRKTPVKGEKRPEPMQRIREVAAKLADRAMSAYAGMKLSADLKLAVAERTLTVRNRLPGAEDVAWATRMLGPLSDDMIGKVATIPGVYAYETLKMADPAFPRTAELKLQAMRIGDAAIATIPNEVFAQTGLNIRAASPFRLTFTVGLANGYHGYLPTPEQHALGGYETWRCRWSPLEVDASTKIEAALADMLRSLQKLPP